MPDLLVRLYDLPDDAGRTLPDGVTIRRGLAPERRSVVDWIGRTFFPNWASECEVAFSSHPIMTWIATHEGKLIGFACADATAKGFFGPTGVAESERGQGIGEALLMAALRGMREAGYAYAIVGGAGPVDFYRKRLDALEIPGSVPGFYRGMLSRRAARKPATKHK
jgi:GNAT superfamily N-acetyltransferase